jgi:Cu-processing system permease protein
VLLGAKTGVWTYRPLAAGPLAAGLLASTSFAALYAPMLAAALFVRSAAFSAAVGAAFFVGGIVASYRTNLASMFEAGVGRAVFRAVTLLLPRVSTLADASAALAGSAPVDGAQLSRMLASLLAFALAALALGVWRFEQKDF